MLLPFGVSGIVGLSFAGSWQFVGEAFLWNTDCLNVIADAWSRVWITGALIENKQHVKSSSHVFAPNLVA